MTIAVDLTPLYDHLSRIERYNMNITKCLIKNFPNDRYILIFKNEIHQEFLEIIKYKNVNYQIVIGKNKFVFIQYKLLKVFNKINANCYLFLSFTSPILFKKRNIYNAIHDLSCWDCPESMPKKMVYYYRVTYKAAIKVSEKIITVSQFSRNRICDKYGLSHDQIAVIYDGLTDIFKNKVESQDIYTKYNLPQQYLLSLSTVEPRKNLQLLITAYQELIGEGIDLPDLVLAGRHGWKLEEITEAIDQKTRKKIHFTGFIDECDLPTIYNSAALFIFPSKYEGFGLPVIEAMSQNTLVLCSNAASLPEIIGKHGIIFESDNKYDLKEKICFWKSLSADKIASMCNNAQKMAFSFDWNKEAIKLHDLLKTSQKN